MMMRQRQTIRKSNPNRTKSLLFRILPTTILLASLVGSILVGYYAHVSMRSSPFRTSSSASSSSRTPRLRMGAYYYAWYEPKQWARWKTKFQPTLGMYDSPNATVLAKHSEWAHQAGIDFFVMSWSTQEEHDTIKEYLQHPKTIPIALHIESQILYLQSRVNRTQPENGTINFDEPCINIYSKDKKDDQAAAVTTFGETFILYMIKTMNEIVLRHPHKYLFVGDRPVFVLYLAREFVNFEGYMERLRKYFQTRFGVRPYFIADMVWFARDRKVQHMMRTSGADHWDSITGYNRYEGRKDESLDEYLDRTELEYHRYSYPYRWWEFLIKETRTVPVVPYVQPGYDDLLIRSDQHGKDTPRPAYERSNGRIYHRFWDLAERLLHDNPCTMKSDEWFVFVTSFNEWHESTAIEPSVEWGEQYLQITKDRAKALYPTCGGG
jgi:hypothetical protein